MARHQMVHQCRAWHVLPNLRNAQHCLSFAQKHDDDRHNKTRDMFAGIIIFFISLFFELYSFPPFIQLWWFNLWWWRWLLIMGIGRQWSRPLHANLTPWLERATHDCTTMTDQECKLNLSIVFSKVINSDPKACFAFITFGGVWCSRMWFCLRVNLTAGAKAPIAGFKRKACPSIRGGEMSSGEMRWTGIWMGG